MSTIVHFVRDEHAATAIEYCMIAGCIAVAIVAAMTQIGVNVNTLYLSAANGLK